MWQWVLGKLEGVSAAGNLHSAHTITEKRAIKGPDAMGCTESILPWCEWQYCLWNAVRHGSKMARGALFRNRVTFKVYSFHLATTRALWCWSSHVWELTCAMWATLLSYMGISLKPIRGCEVFRKYWVIQCARTPHCLASILGFWYQHQKKKSWCRRNGSVLVSEDSGWLVSNTWHHLFYKLSTQHGNRAEFL